MLWSFLHRVMVISSSCYCLPSSCYGPFFILLWSFLHHVMVLPSSCYGPSFIVLWSFLHPVMVLPSSCYGPFFIRLWSFLHCVMILPLSCYITTVSSAELLKPPKRGVLGMTLNCFYVWDSSSGALEIVENFFIAITPRFILSQNESTC